MITDCKLTKVVLISIIIYIMTKLVKSKINSKSKKATLKLINYNDHSICTSSTTTSKTNIIQNNKLKFESLLKQAESLSFINTKWNLSTAMIHLKNANPKFEEIIIKYGLPTIYLDTEITKNSSIVVDHPVNEFTHYHSLIKIIVYQQLSATSAEPIFQRFLSSLNLQSNDIISPQLVHNAMIEIIYIDNKKKISVNGVICGLSESKINYIKDLTLHYLDKNKLQNINLINLSDDELRNKLTAVKGLGIWSVDMFMLFNLYRPNVLPIGDLGVRKGLTIFYNYSNNYFELKNNQLLINDLCLNWKPYSSLATLYMWKPISKDQ